MHILILSPVSKSYFSALDWIKGDTKNHYTYLINERHLNNYLDTDITASHSLVALNKWNDKNILDEVIEIHSKNKIDNIFCYLEEDVQVAAKLRDYLNIQGQNINSANFYRDKFKMKNAVSKKGFDVPNYDLITDYFYLYKFKNKIGYPFIVKPLDGAGAFGCTIINDDEELKAFDYDFKNGNLIAEEFIDYPMYHVDGFCIDGEIKYISCSEYITNCISFTSKKSTMSAQLDQDSEYYKKLSDYANKLIPTLPSPNNFLFHLEVFFNGKDFKFCEIGCRMGGGGIFHWFKDEFKFNPIGELLKKDIGINSCLDKDEQKWVNRYGYLLTYPFEGRLTYFPTEIEDKSVINYHPYAKVGKVYGKSNCMSDNLSLFSIKCSSNQEVREKLSSLDEWNIKNCKYEKVVEDNE